MQETTLHNQLKEIYCQDSGQREVWVGGYLIDVVLEERLIEIQTRNLGALKEKLEALLEGYAVRVVHPIAQEKYIITKNSAGDTISRRRSPKRGRLIDLFHELVYLGRWVNHPNFSLEALLTSEEEIRIADGRGSWRRKGVSIQDRRLVRIFERHLFVTPSDYQRLLPLSLIDPFTNRQLADFSSIPHRLASKMTYTLTQSGLLEIVGKQGKAYQYHFTSHI